MTYQMACAVIGEQERRVKKIDGVRFIHEGYEYRLTYCGGFAAYVAIDRREVGKRNFKYFGGVGAYDCWTVGQVMDKVAVEIGIDAEKVRAVV